MAPVVIYTTRFCPYCIAAKRLLSSKGVAFEEIDARDAGVRADMTQKAGGRYTVPQVFIGDTHVGGSDDLHMLDRQGKLDSMLAAVQEA